jgi:hypothetical protein
MSGDNSLWILSHSPPITNSLSLVTLEVSNEPSGMQTMNVVATGSPIGSAARGRMARVNAQ